MEHGSVKSEMVQHLPHTHNIYAEKNTTVYIHIVEATLGTQYNPVIAPFNHAGNGRGQYLSLKYQFAVPAYWDQ